MIHMKWEWKLNKMLLQQRQPWICFCCREATQKLPEQTVETNLPQGNFASSKYMTILNLDVQVLTSQIRVFNILKITFKKTCCRLSQKHPLYKCSSDLQFSPLLSGKKSSAIFKVTLFVGYFRFCFGFVYWKSMMSSTNYKEIQVMFIIM